MAKTLCELCGEIFMECATRTMEYYYKDRSVVLSQPGHYCQSCGESILSASDLKSTRNALAAFKAKVDNLLAPDEIRTTRKSLQLNQQQAAAICGGGKNAFSRYESGEVLIPRPASNLLKVLAKEKSLLASVSVEVA